MGVLNQRPCHQSTVEKPKMETWSITPGPSCNQKENHQYQSVFNIVIPYVDPRAVPRMVWGLRNLQQASLKSETLASTGSDPAASA